MKQALRAIRLFFAFSLLAAPAMLHAQAIGHYVPGLEGIKGASLPPPGWYVRDYNLFYSSGTLNSSAGNKIPGINLDVFTYANAPRIIWITDTKIFGGYLGLDALVPLIYQSLNVNVPGGRFSDSTFGIGDLFAEATLSWHLQQFDLSLGAGCWAPTGNSSAPLSTLAGTGFWTPMFTAGVTWYVDAGKTWSVSALSRYEINTEQRDTHVTPGQAYTLEWGIAKTLNKTVDLGVVGYLQQQTTRGNPNGSRNLGSVAAIGPEINVAFPKPMMFVSFRYLHEFMAKSRAQGETFSLTLTKRF